MTAVLFLESHGNRTKYTAIAMHTDEGERKKHEEMGFHEGWGKALDQLVAVAKKI
ncbi:MAG: SRPBCC domain-containing protein [Pirellulales bacterium]